MIKSKKTLRLRDKMQADVKHSKQSTLGDLLQARKTELDKTMPSGKKKQIEITEITASAREHELVLKVAFKLTPSRTAFSRVTADCSLTNRRLTPCVCVSFRGRLQQTNQNFRQRLT